MNILEGLKPNNYKSTNQTITKFVIKSRPSLKQNKIQIESQIAKISQNEISQFIEYMIDKSKRFKSQMQENNIKNIQTFIEKHLFNSICIRTLLKSILDKLLSQRRLGKNLKGINRFVLEEIQNGIWNALARQINLFKITQKYEEQKTILKKQLKSRRQQIKNQLKDQIEIEQQLQQNNLY